MPLWHVYHPEGTYSSHEAKAELSQAITSIYTGVGLPAFYVAVWFHPFSGENIWVGGCHKPAGKSGESQLKRPFVRLVGENIAVNMGDDHAWKGELHRESLGGKLQPQDARASTQHRNAEI